MARCFLCDVASYGDLLALIQDPAALETLGTGGAVVLALLVLEAALHVGAKVAASTQPTWDDKAVARGLKILQAVKLLLGQAARTLNKSNRTGL